MSISNFSLDRKVQRFFMLLTREGEERAIAFAKANAIEDTLAGRMGADRWSETCRIARRERVMRQMRKAA